MKTINKSISKFCLLFITTLVISLNSYAQFYEWAYTPGFLPRGAFGSFQSADMHGNGYFIGIDRHCMVCNDPTIKCYNPTGQLIWNFTYYTTNTPMLFLYSVDADSANNRYVLMEFQSLPFQLGNFTINDPYCLIKFNSSAIPVRVTVLPEKYTQVKTDSVGNAFVSTGTKVRRYNKFGLFSWEYNAGFTHKLFLDIYKNNYLINDSVAVRLNPSGVLKYTKVETGTKTVDSKGRLYVNTTGGLKRYDKNSIFQFIRPGIFGSIQVNSNGNIYEFRNDSIIKYNQSGSTIQWIFDNVPSEGIVNKFGDIYLGGEYDPFITDLQLCPFRMPSLGILEQYANSQVWVAKLNGKDPMPFQAAVFTGRVRNSVTDLNNLCTSQNILGGNGPLFQYCTNANSSFNPGNLFTMEISDGTGNFSNAINIGDATAAQIPDSIPYGTAYRIRVVSSTPGVTYHANLPVNLNSNVTIYPSKAELSLTGTQNLCEGFELQLSVATGDTNAHINWVESGNYLPNYQDSTEITIDTAGYYYAVVSNYLCMRQSDTVFVNLNPRPDPSITPSGPTSFCQGDSVILSVNDIDLNTIKWRLNGTNIPGSNDTTLTVNSAGSYAARITNIYGCARTSLPIDVVIPCREGQFSNNSIANIFIYPNPVSNGQKLYIKNLNGECKLEIFNNIGQLVFQHNSIDASTGIEIQMAPGIYLISLNNMNEKVAKMKLSVE